MPETVRKLASYEDASKASCAWVNTGKEKVNPVHLVLYYSRLHKSPAFGKAVGIGLKTKNDVVTPLIRLDMDLTGKGVHFNAVDLSDSSKKLAACLEKTIKLGPKELTQLYMEYIEAMNNRSAQFIWNWWKNGIAGQV